MQSIRTQRTFVVLWAFGLFFGAAPSLSAAEPRPIRMMKTPGGIPFGMQGEKPASPAPTLFVIAVEIANSLNSPDLNGVGAALAERGVICVALDCPCHGADVRPGEASGLNGWRERLVKGEDYIGEYSKKISTVLDYLIAEGYTDEKQALICGTSRGGFIAFHCAAAEKRFKAVTAFAPVTELLVLNEFKGLEQHAGTKAASAKHLADKLAGRDIWVCIGNYDERVGTDDCIAFTRAVVKASIDRKLPAGCEIHVMPSLGHRIHDTAHAEAAVWFAKRIAMQ